MKVVGDTVSIGKHLYKLNNEIGGGAEGTVFEINNNGRNFAVKILKSNKMSPEEKDEIRKHLMWIKETIANNDELKHKLAYPMELLNDELGYVMLYTGEHINLKNYLLKPSADVDIGQWIKNNYNLKKRLQIITRMFKTLELIHINGMLFTDLSPSNIMVNTKSNNIVFIDTDNLRRRKDSYLSVIGTEGYMAPEIYRSNNPVNDELANDTLFNECLTESGKLSAESDLFSAAVIAFQLLTFQHPFLGDTIESSTAEEESKALRCLTDYILKEGTENISNNEFVSLFNEGIIVTKQIQELFYKTFVNGKDNPSLRPTANEFAEAFSMALDMLVKCPICGVERIYYPEEEMKCWLCNSDINRHVILGVYLNFENTSLSALTNKILGNNGDINTRENKFEHLLLSNVLLEEGVPKGLYLRHFEWTYHRDQIICDITLEDRNASQVLVELKNNPYIKQCYVYNTKKNKPKPVIVGRGQRFSFEDHILLIEWDDKSCLGGVWTMVNFWVE